MLHRPDRGFRLAEPEEIRRVRLRLRADRAQGARIAVGRRRAVRRVVRVSRQSRALALYRHHAGGEAIDGGHVATSVSARTATAWTLPPGRRMIRAPLRSCEPRARARLRRAPTPETPAARG